MPLFLHIGQVGYFARHRRRNTLVMLLPMLVEAVTAVWLWWIAMSDSKLLAALVWLAGIWMVTFIWYMPEYARLVEEYRESGVRRLIAWNWVRFVFWTLRSAMMLWIVWNRLSI